MLHIIRIHTLSLHVALPIFVDRDPDEVYHFFRDFRNLPRFMEHLESVQELPDGRSHWIAKGPAGMSVEWDAEIVADDPDRKSTRLNSSHLVISYAVFCLKKK